MCHFSAPLPSRDVFAFIAAHGSVVRFRKGQVVFLQGSSGNTTFCVNKGVVKLSVTSEEGREVIVDVRVPGDFFGEEALISRAVGRQYSAVCLAGTEAIKIESKQVMKILKTREDCSSAFLIYLLKKNSDLQARLANCLLYPGAKRLTHTLLAIANEERLGRLPKMSQQTLAEMIGMTRQYVNVLLKEFRQSSSCRADINSFMFPSLAEMAVKSQQSRKHKR
ncbi:MAG TPA: Crp/Fnr family transcriptional regulator [Terriglobales bacterium]|jgi:CRP-like cAMP-binding protein|nr:Crp/Fnr family transcriptional regulator [Terriglobales bacterium]